MIDFLVDRKRTAIALLIVLIFAGIFGRINIPIENEPEIVIPVVYVGVGLTGISTSVVSGSPPLITSTISHLTPCCFLADSIAADKSSGRSPMVRITTDTKFIKIS